MSQLLLENEYANSLSNVTGDIYYHLPLLRSLATEVNHVTEMGTRWGESTRAFLAAPCVFRAYDIELNDHASYVFDIARNMGKDVQYIKADTLNLEIEETDLLFIDTEHTYDQLSQELKIHGNKARKYLAFHDTEYCAAQLCPAIFEFLRDNPLWRIKYHTRENNGLTVLERTDGRRYI